jgi:two-component system, NarL family, invasion response regulator UvrY
MQNEEILGVSTILIADDHPLIQQYLTQMLKRLNPDCEILTANIILKVIQLAKTQPIDLLLLDIMLDDGISISNIDVLKRIQPQMKILVLSTYSADAYGSRAIQLGADGYIDKKVPLNELINAVKTVMSGQKYLRKDIVYNLAFPNAKNNFNKSPFELLTNREFEIVLLMLQGKTISDIGTEINLQRSTVSTHKMKIFEKLGVSNVLELQSMANKYNIS